MHPARPLLLPKPLACSPPVDAIVVRTISCYSPFPNLSLSLSTVNVEETKVDWPDESSIFTAMVYVPSANSSFHPVFRFIRALAVVKIYYRP